MHILVYIYHVTWNLPCPYIVPCFPQTLQSNPFLHIASTTEEFVKMELTLAIHCAMLPPQTLQSNPFLHMASTTEEFVYMELTLAINCAMLPPQTLQSNPFLHMASTTEEFVKMELTLAIHCAVFSTNSPIKSLLTYGLDNRGVC